MVGVDSFPATTQSLATAQKAPSTKRCDPRGPQHHRGHPDNTQHCSHYPSIIINEPGGLPTTVLAISPGHTWTQTHTGRGGTPFNFPTTKEKINTKGFFPLPET